MEDGERSLGSRFRVAESQRKALESAADTNSASYQAKLQEAIKAYDECRKIAVQESIFSPNESIDDVTTGDLTLLLINYHLGDLFLTQNTGDRKATLFTARGAFERYLDLLSSYSLLSRNDRKLFEQYCEAPNKFSTVQMTDAGLRRNAKIARYKAEKELKAKLEHLEKDPAAVESNEEAARRLFLIKIELCTYQAFASLESLALEMEMLDMMPSMEHARISEQTQDPRERAKAAEAYEERLDPSLSQLLANGKAGPILDRKGKPLKPFTMLDSRERLRQGVFKPGHNLPTMTIDEYLEEEKRRGGIIEGGGEQSGVQPVIDENDIDKADQETMKAREWDEFTEANPKGAGNTLNRG